ncbi:MAG: S-methyl-5'-thioadenosine phosphorylase [Nannocystaceae bacterium]
MANPDSAIHPASPKARRTLVLGVVGGSGLYDLDGLTAVETRELHTPYGTPSGPYTCGELPRPGLAPLRVVFLARHGAGHLHLPGEINYRANIHGFKQLGVTHLVSVSAVGSLQPEIAPGHLVVPDQFIDRTRGRAGTFFGDGIVAHVQLGDPMCEGLRARLLAAATAQGQQPGGPVIHDGGICMVMEGPAFSTRAESNLYRSWGASVIGMTGMPEAKLAREAEMSYALLACSTDYDCWHASEEEVTVEAVVAVMRRNVAAARQVVARLAESLPETTEALPYPRALEHAILTDLRKIPAATRKRIDLIAGHYLRS